VKNFLKKCFRIALRVVVVTLSFTIDIKVKADVLFDTVKGQIEVEKAGSLVTVADKTKMLEPLDVETFNRSLAKFSMNSIFLGLGEKTLVGCLDSPKIDFSWGTIFVSVPSAGLNSKEKKAGSGNGWFSVRTPQAEIGTSGGEFIAVVKDRKTTIHVVSGNVEMKDRSSGESQSLRAGYSDWMAGLNSNGAHVKGRPEAIDFDWVMAQTKTLSRFSVYEYQNRYDHLKPLWRQAVDDVSQQSHDQVVGDMQLLKDIQESDAKRDARHKREQAHLKKMFRDRSLGDPDGLIDVPWQSPREPANEKQKGEN
jgi:hypothetical protein